MSQWTDSARAALERYFEEKRQAFETSGADANEVIEDLRLHVNEEIAAARLGVVTEQDVRRILSRIGAPDAGLPAAPSVPREPARETLAPVRTRKVPGWLLLLAGVLWPLAAIGFEFFTGGCAGILFDPTPTIAHLILTVFVPVTNLWLWLALRREPASWSRWMVWANGVASGVALVYTLMFLPVTPFACIGVIFYGIGLLPLAPLASLFAALALRGHLRRATEVAGPVRGFGPGLGIGMAALVLATLPMAVSEYAVRLAVSESARESAQGIGWLRVVGDRELLLRACYGRAGRSGQLYSWGKPVPAEAAREVYFRVYGEAFNSVPPPALYAGRVRWNLLEDEFTWDNDQGGDAVAGRVKGLSAIASRQDGFVDPNAALAYLEWTLEFKNDSRLQREARAQILLPPGAVVSRLTLWIDGEEREAAFGGRSQVKGAYKAVVQQRRDPVLVTTCGPDRVLMQCFPVPPEGGRMKIRMGMTAPLALDDAGQGRLRWPCFLERNFSLPEDFRHSLWLESVAPMEVSYPGLSTEQPKPGAFAARALLRDAELARAGACLTARRDSSVTNVWARDERGGSGHIVRQALVPTVGPRAERVMLVVDGSKGMDAFSAEITAALAALPAETELGLLVARDGVEEILPPQRLSPEQRQRVGGQIRRLTGSGGHDNVEALGRALELAAGASRGAVVWVHGPQPVSLSSLEPIRQRLERSPQPPLVFSVQTVPGPNRVLEQLDGLRTVLSAPRAGSVEQDLKRVLQNFDGRTVRWQWTRERIPAPEKARPEDGPEVSAHLARLWAAAEVPVMAAHRKVSEATQLATTYQLVTPVSGAVVLETQQQYDQAGLQPVPANTVPVIPEPGAAALWLAGAVAWILRRRRRIPGAG